MIGGTAASPAPIQVTIVYNGPVNAADLTAADFQSQPSGLTATSVSTLDENSIILGFAAPTTGDNQMIYTGTYQNVIHPQTLNY